MSDLLVLRVVAKLLIPFILLFALYVQTHGDFGPGGGFQAGVIFAAGFVLYALFFGVANLRRVLPSRVMVALVALGVTIFAGVGFAALVLGGNFLEYAAFADKVSTGNHIGIWLVEIGVGTTVAAVMITIFMSFAGRGRPDGRDR